MKKSPESRLLARTKRSGECLIWTGAKAGSGYGMIRGIDGRMTGTHQLSYRLYHGGIPKGKQVCHRCDNKLCVEPAHLFQCTQQENINDCISKGRSAKGSDLNHLPQVGQLNNAAKLNESMVLEIRALSKQGESQASIGRKLGISNKLVWCVVNRKTWTHIDGL